MKKSQIQTDERLGTGLLGVVTFIGILVDECDGWTLFPSKKSNGPAFTRSAFLMLVTVVFWMVPIELSMSTLLLCFSVSSAVTSVFVTKWIKLKEKNPCKLINTITFYTYGYIESMIAYLIQASPHQNVQLPFLCSYR